MEFPEISELLKMSDEEIEQFRTEYIKEFIERAPPKLKHRLEGLQFKIDSIIATSSNPLHACIKISNLMYESLGNLTEVIIHGPPKDQKKADVLELKKKECIDE